MIEKINRTDEILKGLEGVILDGPKNLAAIHQMNEELTIIHRDYKYKEAMSEKRAAEVYLFDSA